MQTNTNKLPRKATPVTATVATTAAPVATPTLPNGYTPTLATQVAGAVAIATGGTRKAPPAPSTVAGMLLATLAGGPATLAMACAAVAQAPSTGKVHALPALLRYMVGKWGYTFTFTNGLLACTGRPANG